MAQWVNRLRNKIFVNAPPLPLLCEISGASFRLTKVQHHYSLTNPFQLVFSGKAYCKVDF